MLDERLFVALAEAGVHRDAELVGQRLDSLAGPRTFAVVVCAGGIDRLRAGQSRSGRTLCRVEEVDQAVRPVPANLGQRAVVLVPLCVDARVGVVRFLAVADDHDQGARGDTARRGARRWRGAGATARQHGRGGQRDDCGDRPQRCLAGRRYWRVGQERKGLFRRLQCVALRGLDHSGSAARNRARPDFGTALLLVAMAR
jgi:hypothetical protein